ncbi:hypothetical protein [Tannerella forsythia]|uniref:Uncharacterized protein n=1 Tax=Tannerella forsythia TaxID=28112 RepID=A0A3P1XWW6_TANFO|nr:hypothetical protein [Tannerella forsythia]RRD61423.1 hypothetical protein EII40_06115 [Tannerella forsythia]
MIKIALLIIYNHRYDKNISRIEDLYAERFSHLYHVIPFYNGDKPNVLPVYESSYQFQSYIAQAYAQLEKSIEKEQFSHFFIVADDMIINPEITEDNIFDFTGIKENECYLISIKDISKERLPMSQFHTISSYNIKKRGVEIENILPSFCEAAEKMRLYGIDTFQFRWRYLIRHLIYLVISFCRKKHKKYQIKMIYRTFTMLLLRKKFDYPIVWGGSDCLLLTKQIMPKFCTYCGAFASSELFVEFAIPTALILSADKIVTNRELKLDCISQLYTVDEKAFCEKYKYQLSHLLESYPPNMFFIHPIKLSQWI